MKAVNLIPADTRRSSLDAQSLRGPGPAVIGILVVALALVTVYVLTSNSISQRRAELASLRQQLAQTQAASGELTKYSQFAQLADARATTVREIASSRFNWAKALQELSEVVPSNTTLQSLSATLSPSATAGSTSSGGGNLRGDIDSPAFEMVGCTSTQDDVARLMSRLRLISDVTRVTLADSVKNASAAAGAAVSATGAAGCGANAPSFDVIVFFQGPAGTAPSTSSPATTTPAPTTTTSTTAAPTTTTTSTTSTSTTTAAPTSTTSTSTTPTTGGTQ